jgi:hypothetical protein
MRAQARRSTIGHCDQERERVRIREIRKLDIENGAAIKQERKQEAGSGKRVLRVIQRRTAAFLNAFLWYLPAVWGTNVACFPLMARKSCRCQSD